MTIRVAAIAMVKNESDIIELFVRINARAVDRIYIVDHNSQDATVAIVNQLVKEGLPVTLQRENQIDHNQAEILTRHIRVIASLNEYDFILPLDADEFIYCNDAHFGSQLNSEIPDSHCGQIRWATYATIGDAGSHIEAPLYDLFRMRSEEPVQFHKTIIPNEIAKICNLSEGNHYCTYKKQVVAAKPVSAILQHVPIRSATQIINKALLGSHRLSIKAGRAPNEGFHWDQLANFVRSRNYNISDQDLSWLARRYTLDLTNEHLSTPDINHAGPRIGHRNDKPIYPAPHASTVATLDAFAKELCEELINLRTSRQIKHVPNPPERKKSRSMLARVIASIGKH